MHSLKRFAPTCVTALAGWCCVSDVQGADPVIAPPPSQTTAIDKSDYNLFNPTPRRLLRELAADRPDVTESPYTVDAGHIQLEMDVLRYSYDRYNSARDHVHVENVNIAPFIIKVGVLNSVDIQLGIAPYNSIREHDYSAGSVQIRRGFGPLVPRVKINLWGNDG